VNGPLIDGKQSASLVCTDRGLQYGDGLFETISCRDGRARWLELHFERLRGGLARLRLAFEAFDELRAEIQALASGHERCLIKVIVTRGAATRRGYAPAGDERPTRIVSRHPWPTADTSAEGFRVGISNVRLGCNPLLAGLKHLNRLEQVLAQMGCQESGLSEVLMLSTMQHVIGGSMSNVFFANEHGLMTPDLRDCGVEGVMRRVVLRAAADLGLGVQIRAISMEEIASASEAFFTNVRLGLQSAHWLHGRQLHCDAFAQRLRLQIDATPG
jgi:4-amino-4-deoxychorismate lyase